MTPVIMAYLDNTDVRNLSQVSSSLTLSGNAKDALGIRRQWEMLFKPETRLGDLMAYFEDSGPMHELRSYVSVEWARGNLHRRVPLRPQILLLGHLFYADDDVSPDHFEMMLKTMVVDWRLADGYALGVAIRQTSKCFDDQHRERALNAVRFLLAHHVAFLDIEGFDDYATSASERIAESDGFPVEYDETDAITSALLKLLPDAHRNLVRMALSGLAFDDIRFLIMRRGRNRNSNLDLLNVMVAHGMEIGDEKFEEETHLIFTAVSARNFRAASLLLTLGCGMVLWFSDGVTDDYDCGNDEVFTFAEQQMTFSDDSVDCYIALADHFELWRERLGQSGDTKPVLLETCLKALRRRFGVGFDERAWKHRVFVEAVELDIRIPFDRLLALVDDGTVILSGPGVSTFTNFYVCDVDDPVSVLDRLARDATDAQVHAALSHVTEDGYTIFHKKCMTGDIVRWILRRASTWDWVWGALQRIAAPTWRSDGGSCMRLWIERREPSYELRILTIVANLADANGTMSAYETAMMACAGNPMDKVNFLSWSASTTLINGHLEAHFDVMNPYHEVLMLAKIGAEPLGPILNRISARNGDTALQTFLLERYDGFSPIHWAVMMDLPAVEAAMEQAERLGVLSEVVVHRDSPVGWTILHMAATSIVMHFPVPGRFRHMSQPSYLRHFEQMETLSQMVFSLRARLASLDDFCQLMDARDYLGNRTFLGMLPEVLQRFGVIAAIAAFIRRQCNNIRRRLA
ncbi:hypothetical protein PBRA_002639 [Plasmodiophora brassicae]|nr:hypothetical protein PBRA_002639 [Plasmodiophora brassicae]